MSYELDTWCVSNTGSAFVFSLNFRFDEQRRPLKTTISSSGVEVENGSYELWTSKSANFVETMHCVVGGLRLPQPNQANVHAVESAVFSTDLLNFLSQEQYASQLRLSFVHKTNYQFKMKDDKISMPLGLIDDIMEFGRMKFGSFASEKIRKQHRKDYREIGAVSIGYVGFPEYFGE